MTEDEMVGWHHQINGREFEHTPGDGERQGHPGMLQSLGSQRVCHDRVTELSLNWGYTIRWCALLYPSYRGEN